MANKQNVGVPWIMCQQDDDVPHNVINTCNGFYCHDWFPNRTGIPKIWTENWTGWFKAWDKPDFHRSVEDIAFKVATFFQKRGSVQNYYMVCYWFSYSKLHDLLVIAFAVATFFQKRGSVQNYYMYHGGTNFGQTSGGPYITTSYDYDAPLDEYGNIRHPKYGHLKDLHNVLKSVEKILVHGEYSDTNYGKNIIVINECDSFKKTQLLEEISTSTDQSDYLWYTTSLEHKGEGNYTLYVNTTGDEIYAFVNGKLVGQNHSTNGAFVFQLESPANLHSGKNYISLLSGIVGKNYGPLFELMPAGIVGGPVKLLGANDTTIDLTNSSWSYKSGLAGEYRQVHLDKPGCKWQSHNGSIPVNMIKLLFKYGASANLRTACNEIIENLLPLHVAVDNTYLPS